MDLWVLSEYPGMFKSLIMHRVNAPVLEVQPSHGIKEGNICG